MINGQIGVGVIGIDHRHIYGQLQGMLDAGCACKGWWTQGEPPTLAGFVERFPEIPRVSEYRQLLDDPEIDMILLAAIPADRAKLSIEAMHAGKDVMSDKPGCTSLEQLAQLEQTIATTKQIFSIDFSERFEVPAVQKAAELVFAGEIGKVVQTVGLGPHRLNRHTRPEWFFHREQYGGILTDIGSHQIDQFLFFTQAHEAEIISASVGNFANPDAPELEDFGEILIKSKEAQGYIRVDWYTPDALPNWGDGRLTILGTQGYIELRKYVDVAGRAGTDHLFIVTDKRCEYIDCQNVPLPYFADLVADIRKRTETAMSQQHCLTAMRLALQAQQLAERRGNLNV